MVAHFGAYFGVMGSADRVLKYSYKIVFQNIYVH